MKKLHISDSLSLPLDFVTQTQAILAKKRVGKTYTAMVEAEELLIAEQIICAIDPTGAWWGLKSSADGKSKGFPIVVFGGEHADVPLEESAGETIAQAIVEQRFSAIIDLSLLRKGQINRFMAPFLETLYRLNRAAMHLFVDEADAIAPQKPFGEEARMLGAMEDVVRRGGIRGIGCTLITQRPAVLNKNVLTQCEILCALRIVHHKDIDAIHEWIAVHGDPSVAKEMIASLPALPIGEAWFWSPGWGDIFQRVKIRERQTFDSGATPKAGEVKRTPKVLASVDLEVLGQQIQSTVQRAKENDPKQLKAEIAKLKGELAKKSVAVPAPPPADPKIVEVPAVSAEQSEEFTRAVSIVRDTAQKLDSSIAALSAIAATVSSSLAMSGRKPTISPAPRQSVAVARLVLPKPAAAHTNGDSELSGPQMSMLSRLAEFHAIGRAEVNLAWLASSLGTTVRARGFEENLRKVRALMLVEVSGGKARLTAEGDAIAGEVSGVLDVRSKLREMLSGPQDELLATLDQVYPHGMQLETLAATHNTTVRARGFEENLRFLRSNEIIEVSQGVARRAEWVA